MSDRLPISAAICDQLFVSEREVLRHEYVQLVHLSLPNPDPLLPGHPTTTSRKVVIVVRFSGSNLSTEE
jgi:hypothetical protein